MGRSIVGRVTINTGERNFKFQNNRDREVCGRQRGNFFKLLNFRECKWRDTWSRTP